MPSPKLNVYLKLLKIGAISVFAVEAMAQPTLTIAIVSDGAAEGNHLFENAIKSEVNTLLSSQFTVDYREFFTNGSVAEISNAIEKVYSEDQVDVLVGIGVLSSKIISEQSNYPLPSIASIHLNFEPNANEVLPNERSGVFNYTYINSPFNVQEGIRMLESLCTCQNLAVITNSTLFSIGLNGMDMQSKGGSKINWIAETPDLKNVVSMIPNEVGGIYILSPLYNQSENEIAAFFDALNERKLISFSAFELPHLEQGAYAAFAVSDNLRKIPRRIALNIERIALGENPKDFPVSIEAFSNQLMLNMATVNRIGKYPKWEVLDDALLININTPHTDRVLSLKAAIAEGIENNLSYKIEQKQTQINSKDLSLAKGNYLPKIDAGTTGYFLDENSVNSSFGRLGSFNWTANGSLSQLIVSEPAMANIAIQKLLYESQKKAQKQSELDVILEVAQRYFSYMQVLSVAELQNNNIKAVNQNLTIAKNKEKAGYSGSSDVFRWQTELDLAKSDLNTTTAQLNGAGFQLNETLNRPIKEAFALDDAGGIDQFIEELDEILIRLIEDQAIFNRFADFMVSEAKQNLPELEQIKLAIGAQERLLKSNKRAMYIPTVAFGANYDYPIETINRGEPLPIPGIDIDVLPGWNAAFNVAFPIFTGGARKYEKDKAIVGLNQLRDQEQDLNNVLELQVRANMAKVTASYNNTRLTKAAATSAEKNTAIVRELYESGQVDVITLIDAQNALLGAQVNATNASYQFMIDYFLLQRSTGNYTFLATEAQRREFLQRFITFKNN